MIKVLDKNFQELGELTNLIKGTVAKVDSGSWTIDISVIKDDALTNYLTRENYLLYKGQKFTIRKVDTSRNGEEKYVSVTAEHVFYELEDQVVPDDYKYTGNLAQHITKMLAHQVGTNFSYESGGVGDMYSIVRTISLNAGSMTSVLKKILDHFYGRLVLDNYKIKPIPQLQVTPSNVIFEYGVQNDAVNRSYSRDDVVTRIVCNAIINGVDKTKIYTATSLNDYRNPITRLLDFGELDSQSDMDWLAGEYLSVHGSPDAEYRVNFAELKHIDGIFPGRDFAIDTGMLVSVKDDDLGLDLQLPVKSYTYDLVDPKIMSRVTLGTLRKMRTLEEQERREKIDKRVDQLVVEGNIYAWSETVMSYVSQVIGGTIRDVNAGFLIFVPPVAQGATRKTLSDCAERLAFIKPDYAGAKYNQPFEIKDPVAQIREEKNITLRKARDIILDYIRDNLGITSGGITSAINYAYDRNYGNGQVVSYPEDTADGIFGEDFESGSKEYEYADDIISDLQLRTGNISEIYLEIGGGNTGIIGAINDLYSKLSKPEITVSPDAPEESQGKDGDLWFQYSEEEEDV